MRPVAVWRFTAALGFVCGALLWSVRATPELSKTAIALTIVVNLASFVGLQQLAWIIRGSPRTVLIEHVLCAGIVTFALTIALDLDTRTVMDAWIPSLCLTLAIGRVGCLFSGCCHGRPSPVGFRYPWKVPRDLQGSLGVVRLAPVQFAESLLLFFLCALELGPLSRTPPGFALPWFTLVYGVGRFLLEFARGDACRRYFGRLSEAQVWCLTALVCLSFFERMRTAALLSVGLLCLVCLLFHRHVGPPLFLVSDARFLADRDSAPTSPVALLQGQRQLILPHGLILEFAPGCVLLSHPQRTVSRGVAEAVAVCLPPAGAALQAVRKDRGRWQFTAESEADLARARFDGPPQ